MSWCCQPAERSASVLVRSLPNHMSHYTLTALRSCCASQGVIPVSIPNEVHTWHTAQIRRNIWNEYLLGIFIKCLGSCWLHHLKDGSSIKNYTGSIRGFSLRWRQVLQACQNDLLVPSRNFPTSESAGGHAMFSCWMKSSRLRCLVWELM